MGHPGRFLVAGGDSTCWWSLYAYERDLKRKIWLSNKNSRVR